MDGDGQHPPEMRLGQMIDLVKQGYDIVQAQRIEETGGFSFKKATSGFSIHFSTASAGRMFSRGPRIFPARFRARRGMRSNRCRELPPSLCLRGMIAWMASKSAILPYHEPKRHCRQVQVIRWENVPPGVRRNFSSSAYCRFNIGFERRRHLSCPGAGADYLRFSFCGWRPVRSHRPRLEFADGGYADCQRPLS